MRRTPEETDKLAKTLYIRRYNQGETCKALAEIFGISEPYCWKLINRHATKASASKRDDMSEVIGIVSDEFKRLEKPDEKPEAAKNEAEDFKDWCAYQMLYHFVTFAHMQDEITTELYTNLIDALLRLKPDYKE